MKEWAKHRRHYSAIDAEGGVAGGKEADNLTRGGEAGIGVGFGSLGTEFFGRGVVAIAESGDEVFVAVGTNVGEIGEIGALGEELQEFIFVNDFLARGVDQDAAGAHEFDHLAIDKLAGARRGGGVKTDDVALLHEIIEVVCGVGAVFLDALDAIEKIVGADFHLKAAGDAGYTARHVAVGQETDALSSQLGAGSAFVVVAHMAHEQPEDEFGHGIGVLSGGVHHDDVALGGGIEIHIVHAGTGSHHNAQTRSGIEHCGIDKVAANDEGVNVGHGAEQGGFVGVFLEQAEGVTR